MAQLDRPQRRESPTTPTTIEMLRDGGEVFPRSSTSPRLHQDHHPEEDHGHHKKSVISKVKEKAKKLKLSLSFKKKHSDHNHDHETPSPMYESEMVSECNNKVCEKHILPTTPSKKGTNVTFENPITKSNRETKPNEDEWSGLKTLKIPARFPETVIEEVGPASNSAANQGPSIFANSRSSSISSPRKSGSPGAVSVKNYLMNKFEPAEEDKALSRAISEAIIGSPRAPRRTNSGAREASMAENVKDAVTSLLKNNQSLQPRSPGPVLTRSGSPLWMSRRMPVSTNAREVDEETLGRILQTN